MAWVERSGEHTWRVRHRRDGTVTTIPITFASDKTANDYGRHGH